MKLKVIDNKLSGGTDIDIKVTKELLEKYIKAPVDISDIDECIDALVEELNLNLRYGVDTPLFTLALLLECMNASSDSREFERYLTEYTPFNNSLSGFVLFIMCQLEAAGLIHNTKYNELTEKGKVLLWLFRNFEFADTERI